MSNRSAIPAELRRRLLIEAGHRCAIPTCRAAAPLEVDHIVDWAEVQRHDFENMIVLCANCHGRKGNGPGQIDRKSLRQYKANLAIINSRYSDLERRVLEEFIRQRAEWETAFGIVYSPGDDWPRGLAVPLPGTMRIMMKYLVQDGYIERSSAETGEWNVGVPAELPGAATTDVRIPAFLPTLDFYSLTVAGIEFLDAYAGARPIDEGLED